MEREGKGITPPIVEVSRVKTGRVLVIILPGGMLIGKSPEYSVLSVFCLNNTETIIYCVVLFSYHFVDVASNLSTWIYYICMGSMLMLVCK